jgi:PAS domain S-box-containing protein
MADPSSDLPVPPSQGPEINLRAKQPLFGESGERLGVLFEANPLPMWIFDLETLRFLAVNEAAIRRYGYSRQEFLAMTVRDIRPPEELLRLDEALVDSARGLVQRGAFRHRTRDGSLLDVEVTTQELPWNGRSARAAVVFDVTEREKAERRTRFVAQLSQALQPITDPDGATATAARMLGEQLGVDRCAYAEVEPDENHFTITGDYTRGDMLSISGRFAMSAFGAETLRLMRENQPYVVDDVEADPRVTPADRAAYEQTQIRSVVCVPLHKAGRFIAGMAVHQRTPRHWRADEVELVTTVTQRCWESVERARAMRALLESEQRLRLAQEAGRIGVFEWWIPEGRIIWSEELERLYGVPAGTFEGTFDHWRKRVIPEDARRVETEMESALRDRQEEYVDEFPAVLPDGTHRWLAVQARFVYDPEGRPLRMIGVNIDIHERKQAEQERERLIRELEASNEELQSQAVQLEEVQAELEMANDELQRANAALTTRNEEAERANAAAQEANRAKSAFLANMSHELRTPINAVTGYTDLMELGIAGPLTDTQAAHLGRIKASTHHLLSLVNQVLDLAKVESGQLQVEPKRVMVAETVREALDLIGPQAAGQGVELLNRAAGSADAAYWGDPDRVRQILVNLLSNAVKFTPAGGRVTIAYRTTGEPDPDANLSGEGPWIGLEVEDTGIGIPPEEQQSVFEPFVQVDASHTRERDGTGLGLTISRQLARLMDGDLTVRSSLGRGSCFTLWLPAASGETAAGGDRRIWPRVPLEIPRLSEVGHALARCADAIVEEVGDRLRSDPPTPGAENLDRAQLEDHTATFLVDIGLALVALDEGGGEPALIQDGTEIQRTISHLHGAQRARLAWPEAALRREFEILREVTAATLRRTLPDAAGQTVEEAMGIVERLLDQAERIGVRGWTRAVREQS